MIKRNLYLITYKNADESCIYVYGSNIEQAQENFWKWANAHVRVPGVSLYITDIKSIGNVLVEL